MVSNRLLHLQTEVQDYYEQLGGKEKAKRLAPQEEKIRLKQQIKELREEIGQAERDYWFRLKTEFAGLAIPDAEANDIVTELLSEVESIEHQASVQTNDTLISLLQEIKATLTQMDFSPSAKLKAAIPLLPGFISYELEFETAGLLQRTFPTFCNLFKTLDTKKP